MRGDEKKHLRCEVENCLHWDAAMKQIWTDGGPCGRVEVLK